MLTFQDPKDPVDDSDFDEPLPERPSSCNMDEGCESCQ